MAVGPRHVPLAPGPLRGRPRQMGPGLLRLLAAAAAHPVLLVPGRWQACPLQMAFGPHMARPVPPALAAPHFVHLLRGYQQHGCSRPLYCQQHRVQEALLQAALPAQARPVLVQ